MHERFQCSVVTNVCMHVQVLTLTYMLTQMPREAKSGAGVTEGYTGAGTEVGSFGKNSAHSVGQVSICL